jgi:hypothetical protein
MKSIVLLGASLCLAVTLGCSGKPAASAKKVPVGVASDTSGQDAGEISFNSKFAFGVWTADAEGEFLQIGKTPAETPIRIPAGVAWGVMPIDGTTVEATAAEVRAQSIPGLWLPWDSKWADLAQFKGLEGLQTINLRYTKATDAGLARLKGLRGLRMLDLECTKITDAGLTNLRDLAELQVLDLDSTAITDAGLVHLKDLQGLRTLRLFKTQITDAGLAHLRSLVGLRTLNLSDTPITDDGLVQLKDLMGLGTLYLSGTKITDAGLVHLKDLRELRALYLWGAKVTDAGVAELKKSLPNTIIGREPGP